MVYCKHTTKDILTARKKKESNPDDFWAKKTSPHYPQKKTGKTFLIPLS